MGCPATRASKRRWQLAALLALTVAALAIAGWRWIGNQPAPIAIAVLPLENLSRDPANDYFSDALTGELIRDLAILDGLTVRSQTSSFALKGKPRNIRDAGRMLAADYILEGSVFRAGDQLRVLAQLIRVRDDFPVWSGKYERQAADVLAIQEEISRAIVNNLRLKVGRGRRRYETNAEGYDLYLRAMSLGIQVGPDGFSRSVPLFEQVIAKDPAFAPAYAGLAQARLTRSQRFQFDMQRETREMRSAAQKAIELDPFSTESYDALATAAARDAQWEQARTTFMRAIELDPRRPETRSHYAIYYLGPLGLLADALTELHLAEKGDPLSGEIQFFLWRAARDSGHADEAAAACGKLAPEHFSKRACQLELPLRQGRFDEVIRALEAGAQRSDEAGWRANYLGCAYAQAGRRADAEQIVKANPTDPFIQANISFCLGDKDRTFEALDRVPPAPGRFAWAGG
jgi:TolB-like protein/Flp pilus assembly protein TadD